MPDIDTEQLDVALTALGEQLIAATEKAHLVVIGGSGLLAIDAVVRSTRDVDVLALERHAAADRREPRDFADLQQLAPTADELRAGARWARTHNMPGPFDDAIARALADLGVEDAGRDA
jgi:hypothetical protein